MSSTYKGYGIPFEMEPYLQMFLVEFNKLVNEIGVTETQPLINSHKFNADISVICLNNDKEYKIVGLRLHHLGGCGCPSDISIEIEELIDGS